MTMRIFDHNLGHSIELAGEKMEIKEDGATFIQGGAAYVVVVKDLSPQDEALYQLLIDLTDEVRGLRQQFALHSGIDVEAANAA